MTIRFRSPTQAGRLLVLLALSAALAGCFEDIKQCEPGSASNPCKGNAQTSPPDVTIANLRNNGVVQTGFLIGTAQFTGLTAVEISLDGGATWSSATGTANWKFQLPTGANTWRDGTQHTIQARATDGISFSAVTSVTVRKGVNKDVNGDGYADVVVGAHNYSTSTGRVYVFHSVGNSGVTATLPTLADTTITGEANFYYFGQFVALGDVNGDGYADVVAGSHHTGDTGRLYVFHSAGSGGITATLAASANTIITGEAAGNFFSLPVALGDVNGDGYSDVVAGAYNHNSGTGRVYVFHSAGSAGVNLTSAASATTIISGEATGNQFGLSMALGDVNGDGYADLAVGANGYNTNMGRLYVFHSAGSAGVSATGATSADTIITGEATGNQFGLSMALGDVNGDGYADMAAHAYGYSTFTGRLYVFRSAGNSGVTATLAASANTIIIGEATNNYFGESVALSNVNGDGFADLVVGAPGYNGDTGRLHVFHSAGSTGVFATAADSANTVITGEATNIDFGASVAR